MGRGSALDRREFLRILAAGGAAGALAPLLAACQPTATPGASPTAAASVRKEGELLKIAIGTEPGSLDPANVSGDTIGAILWEIAPPLGTYFNRDGKLTGALAESWTASSDAKTFTYALRKGVKFSDGTPFNAEAVKFNLSRVIDPRFPVGGAARLRDITAIDVLDETQVRITIKSPLSYFPYWLAYYTTCLISPSSVNSNGNSFDKIVFPVGAGPYKFVEYVKASHVTLERNDSYWGPKPAWKRVQFLVAPEAATREAMVLSGDADIALSPPPADVAKLRTDSRVTVVTQKGNRAIFVGINTVGANAPALRDPRVRQALNYAVNKQDIIDKVLFGLGTVMDSPTPPVHAEYKSSGSYAYDPNKAKQLLRDAGATNLSLKLVSPTGRYLQDFQAATAVAGYLQEVGIKVDGPKTMDFPTLVRAVLQTPPAQQEFDIALFGFQSPTTGASLEFFQGRAIPPGGLNFYGENNPQVDAAVDAANSTGDAKSAADQYARAQKLIWDDAPWIFLWTESPLLIVSSKVQGVSMIPLGVPYVDESSPV
jgi:ABC-type transport system substrate-binding protein